MAYITTSGTAVIDAVLTRQGRAMMASSTQQFQITQWAVADPEVNYQIINSQTDTVDNDDPNIINLPIPQASTNGANEMFSKIYVNNTFLDQQFTASAVSTSQRVAVTTTVGDVGMLFSDDTSKILGISVTTYNPINLPYVGANYTFTFNSQYDFYTLGFVNPPNSTQVNNNWSQPSNNTNQYLFSAANSDSSGTYTQNSQGSPCIVINVQLLQTPMLYSLLAMPANSQSLLIPNFLTITQTDASGTALPNVSPATLSLQVINVL